MPSPANRLVIALAQIPSIVGDIAGNRDRVRKARAEAAAFGADLMLTPELYLAGDSVRASRRRACVNAPPGSLGVGEFLASRP